MTNKYSSEYRVSLFDAGPGGAIKIPVLFNHFQAITGDHANSIGFGGGNILRQGYHWIISRYRLSVVKLPRINEKFIITTWRSGEKGNFVTREFFVKDAEGETMIQSTSSWMLLNYKKMEPVKPSSLFPGYPENSDRALDDSFTTIPEISLPEYEKGFVVRRNDLDMNNHVNNSIYTAWILETGEDLSESRILKDININFRSEARYGESVISQAVKEKESGKIFHKLIGKESGNELTRGITEWI